LILKGEVADLSFIQAVLGPNGDIEFVTRPMAAEAEASA
jgi:hypothetical protein